MKKQQIKWMIVCICVLVAGICYVTCESGLLTGSQTVFTVDGGGTNEPVESGVEPDVESDAKPDELKTLNSPEKILVHVCGEVISPGVYEMEVGSRIYEAVERAGGCTTDAASDFLNMAQVLEDGMKIMVPDCKAAEAILEQGDTSAKININTASKEQLMTLKGIGESRAEDIISYRKEYGSFDKIEDIMKVAGIKEAAFQKIRENITV
ncbi:MAG: helix-hairpin-helix domain-containing protein [Clostridium sp.]